MPEAFAAMFYIHALWAGVSIRVDGPLSKAWVDQVRPLAKVFAGWLGVPENGQPLNTNVFKVFTRTRSTAGPDSP